MPPLIEYKQTPSVWLSSSAIGFGSSRDVGAFGPLEVALR